MEHIKNSTKLIGIKDLNIKIALVLKHKSHNLTTCLGKNHPASHRETDQLRHRKPPPCLCFYRAKTAKCFQFEREF